MKATDFITIWDRRNVEGDIVGMKTGGGTGLYTITTEQLRDMNIFDLRCTRSHIYNTEPITICDQKGNRMIVDSLRPYPSRYGFGYIGKTSKYGAANPIVDSLCSLPWMGLPGWAEPGMIFDVDNKPTTVEKARAQ